MWTKGIRKGFLPDPACLIWMTEHSQKLAFSDISRIIQLWGIDGYNRAATPLKTIYSRVIVSEPEEDALFLHFGKADCMIVVYVNNLLVSMV